ncbi:SHPK [Lepeophtheirus salmonis]|uniref:SHPK n=1 Tax=Lepeophtheirus salmonis TaxID=72036 RepID=A0A7R8CZC1_LEPSM|nr:SHPK [Lepeophtheirus salmonis]CAF2975151.1 SHPK [Lepeophtheirus salmonis]
MHIFVSCVFTKKYFNLYKLMDMSIKELLLGVDIGTTSVKKKDTAARITPDIPGGDLQDSSRIYYALHSCMNRLPKENLSKVRRITFCGQMHGVTLWNKTSGWRRKCKNSSDQFEVGDVSPLYTWQDKRCDSQFLSTLPRPNSHLRVGSGYGCSTLIWLHQRNLLKRYDYCGTIMDFIIGMITETENPSISLQNAASFGYCNTITRQWNAEQLREIKGFPLHFLPNISNEDQFLKNSWFDIPQGTPISPSLGDFQCSTLATIKNKKSAVLNLSTSAQIAFIIQESHFIPKDENEIIEYFPFFDNQYMAVAASLTGGNALAEFVHAVQCWVIDLGLSIPQSKIWDKLLTHGDNACDEENPLQIRPTIFGERHNPEEKGQVSNVVPANLNLGSITHGICRGIVQNMASMMGTKDLKNAGIELIMGSGSALLRNEILKKEIKLAYDIPVEFVEQGNACYGAALRGIHLMGHPIHHNNEKL